VLLTAAVVIVADQVSKSEAEAHLGGAPVHVLGPLDLILTYNSGAAFSIGRGLSPVIVVLVVGLVLGVLAYTAVLDTAVTVAAAGLVLGGALSNLGDRLFRSNGGAVIDWIHLSHWPTFNVADSCVVIGVILLVVVKLFGRPSPA